MERGSIEGRDDEDEDEVVDELSCSRGSHFRYSRWWRPLPGGCDCAVNATQATREGFAWGAVAQVRRRRVHYSGRDAGVLVPVLGRSSAVPWPDDEDFFVTKAFAADVIRGTGEMHIPPATKTATRMAMATGTAG